jgi:hypothetical protein
MIASSFFVALLLTSGSAERMPSFKFRLNPFKTSALENIGGDLQVSSDITNKFSVASLIQWGVNQDDIKVDSVSASVSDIDVMNNKMNGNMKLSMSDNNIIGDVEVIRNNGLSMKYFFKSEGGAPKMDSVRLTQEQDGCRIASTFDKDLKMDVEASAEFDSFQTKVSVDHNGKSKYMVNSCLNSETVLKMNGENGEDLTIGLDRSIGKKDIISPSFQVKDKHFKLGWTHRFKNFNMHTTLSEADKSVDMTLGNYDGGLNFNVKAPLNSPQDATFSLTQEFKAPNFSMFKKLDNDE